MAKSMCVTEVKFGKDGLLEGMVHTFRNGHKVTVDVKKIPAPVLQQLLAHGIKQKTRDCFANAKDDVNWAIAQCEATVDALHGGSFNRKGGAAGSGGLLVEAIARIKGYDLATAKEKVDGLEEKDREALEKSATVKAAIADIRAERAKANAKGKEDEALGLV